VAIFLGLALSAGIWCTAICHYYRYYSPRPSLSPGLHHIEVAHVRSVERALGGDNALTNAWVGRTRVTWHEYEVLAASGVPARQFASYRSRLLLAVDPSAPLLAVARFAGADFFGMFQRPLGAGRAYTRDEEARGDAVVVLGRRTAANLFGKDALDHTVLIEGRPFRVVGVLAEDQPYRADWDVATMGALQDALYLPWGWGTRLLARPEHPIYQAPAGPTFADLLQSPTVFVSFWADLPTPDSRAAYAAYLQLHAAELPGYRLRSFPEWNAAFPVPPSPVSFFTLLSGFVLLGGAFNSTRLLLAKGLARREELQIHRALGATRRSLFFGQLLEMSMVALPAALAAIALAIPYIDLFNRIVADTDIPVRMVPATFLAGLVPAFLMGLLSAVYPAWQLALIRPSVQMGRRA
jgi:putative ABC transport system permease protein